METDNQESKGTGPLRKETSVLCSVLGRVGRRAYYAQGRHLLLTSADRSEPKTLHVHNRLWTALERLVEV